MSNFSDPMDCSPLGSSIHGIFQARVLEWGAIAFSKAILKICKIMQVLIYDRLYIITLHISETIFNI